MWSLLLTVQWCYELSKCYPLLLNNCCTEPQTFKHQLCACVLDAVRLSVLALVVFATVIYIE